MKVLQVWHWRGSWLFLALAFFGLTASDTSNRHCFFNQLCSCKVSNRFRGGGPGGAGPEGGVGGRPSQVDEFGNLDYYDGSPVVTTPQVSGQFGPFGETTTEGRPQPPRAAAYRAALGSGSRRRGLPQLVHNVEDISCVGVPFDKIPGRI